MDIVNKWDAVDVITMWGELPVIVMHGDGPLTCQDGSKCVHEGEGVVEWVEMALLAGECTSTPCFGRSCHRRDAMDGR